MQDKTLREMLSIAVLKQRRATVEGRIPHCKRASGMEAFRKSK